MARRGQCRCGLVLTFHRTAQGYKMRCPSCGAVVRLRVDDKRPQAPPAADEIDVELVAVPEPADTDPPSSPRPRRRAAVLIVVGAALLAVVGGVVWWILS